MRDKYTVVRGVGQGKRAAARLGRVRCRILNRSAKEQCYRVTGSIVGEEPVRLRDKVAIVTGAASGIGRGIARIFAQEGARVIVVTDRRVDWGQETVRMIESAGGTAAFVQADVSVASDVARMVRFAVETYGRLDILVNNANWTAIAKATDMLEEDWDRSIDVGLKSVFLGAKYAVPEMIRAGGGSIVNISSGNGIFSNPGFGAYSAAKAGMHGLTRSLAIDWGAYGIRVNVIAPGFVEVERDQEALKDPLEAWSVEETSLLGRRGKPEDVAWMAVFLASDESGYVTGATFVVDGGVTITSPESFIRPSFRQGWRKGRLVLQED